MMSGSLEIDLLVILYLVLCVARDAWSILKTILYMCYRPKCKTLDTGSADTTGMEMSGHSSFRDCRGIECVYQLTTSNKVPNFERIYLQFFLFSCLTWHVNMSLVIICCFLFQFCSKTIQNLPVGASLQHMRSGAFGQVSITSDLLQLLEEIDEEKMIHSL